MPDFAKEYSLPCFSLPVCNSNALRCTKGNISWNGKIPETKEDKQCGRVLGSKGKLGEVLGVKGRAREELKGGGTQRGVLSGPCQLKLKALYTFLGADRLGGENREPFTILHCYLDTVWTITGKGRQGPSPTGASFRLSETESLTSSKISG